VKSKQLLAVLHTLFPLPHPLFFFWQSIRSLGTQCAQTFFILKFLWITAWIVAWQRCCQLQFISGYVPFSMMSKTCCKADDWAVDRWLRLIHFLTDSCPVLKLSTHQSTVLWFVAAYALTATSRWWVSAADMTVHFFGINEWLIDCVLRKPCLLSDATAWLVALWLSEHIMPQQGASDYQSTNGCLVAQWCKKGHFWVVVWFWLWELVWHAALESDLIKELFLTIVGSSHSPHKIHKFLWPQWSFKYIWSLIWEVIYVLWLSAAVDYIRQLDVTLLFFF
jgi:hypothetical protein